MVSFNKHYELVIHWVLFPTPSTRKFKADLGYPKKLLWWIRWKRICLLMQEICVQSLGQKDPLKKGMVTHSAFLPGEALGQRSLAGYSPWDPKESDMTEQLIYTCRILVSFNNLCDCSYYCDGSCCCCKSPFCSFFILLSFCFST